MGSIKDVFHRMGSPRFFYQGSSLWVRGLYIGGTLGLIIGSFWGLALAPPDKYQGDSFRIMYIHVPSAHLAEMVYFACAVAGFVYVVWRMKMADVFIAAAAPVGAILTLLSLASGILWGMPTWGTGWVWDMRTTSVLVLLFLFFGLIALRQAIPRPDRAAYSVAILALVGVVNIPIIKYSVEWFTTLHQPASITFANEPTIETSMLWPLLVNTIGLYIFIAGVIVAAMRVGVLKREQATEWVRDITRSMQR